MADNIALPASSGTVATDDISGIQYQRVKLAWGVDGAAVDASATNPLPVDAVTYTGVAAGEVIVGTAAVQFPTVTSKMVYVRASGSNAGTVYIGGSGVTVPDGTADTTTGYPIIAGEKFGPVQIGNVNQLYAIASTAAQAVLYFANS